MSTFLGSGERGYSVDQEWERRREDVEVEREAEAKVGGAQTGGGDCCSKARFQHLLLRPDGGGKRRRTSLGPLPVFRSKIEHEPVPVASPTSALNLKEAVKARQGHSQACLDG